MEVKDVIKWIEWAERIYHSASTIENLQDYKFFMEQGAETINLLQSLETTIKGYEVAYTKEVLEKDKLKKELEAYKEMWWKFKGNFGLCGLEHKSTSKRIITEMNILERKYLGGGE